MKITEIIDPHLKSAICNDVLRALPNWFGNEAAIIDYTNRVQNMPVYAAYDGETPIGFVAIKIHNAYTAEVCVMGVYKKYHRRGIGRQLISCCVQYCEENGHGFLTVKTLDASAKSKSYEKTRLFYSALGFRPLEVFPLFWDEDNPCLLMAKHICQQ